VLADLLGAIAMAPNVHGAACVTHRDVFDATTGKAAGRPGTYGPRAQGLRELPGPDGVLGLGHRPAAVAAPARGDRRAHQPPT
jgi:hypothetical protein